MMKISIIIPCFNCNATIDQTLESIIVQDYNNYEVIVVDDNAALQLSQQLKNIVDAFSNSGLSIRYIKNPENSGAAKSRNIGLNHASGQLVCFIDADDIMAEGKLRHQASLFKNENVVWTITNVSLINMNGVLLQKNYYSKNPVSRNKIKYNNYVVTSTVMVRKEVLTSHSLLFRDIKTCDDWDMWIRLSEICLPRYLDIPYTRYRINTSGVTRGNSPYTLFKNQLHAFLLNRNNEYLLHFLYFNLKKLMIRYVRMHAKWEKKY